MVLGMLLNVASEAWPVRCSAIATPLSTAMLHHSFAMLCRYPLTGAPRYNFSSILSLLPTHASVNTAGELLNLRRLHELPARSQPLSFLFAATLAATQYIAFEVSLLPWACLNYRLTRKYAPATCSKPASWFPVRNEMRECSMGASGLADGIGWCCHAVVTAASPSRA